MGARATPSRGKAQSTALTSFSFVKVQSAAVAQVGLASAGSMRGSGAAAPRAEAMSDIYPAKDQRLALLELVKALGARDNSLRRDECGDWRIEGRSGHIYAVPGSLDRPDHQPRLAAGFQVYIARLAPNRILQATAASQRHFSLVKVLQRTQSQPQ